VLLRNKHFDVALLLAENRLTVNHILTIRGKKKQLCEKKTAQERGFFDRLFVQKRKKAKLLLKERNFASQMFGKLRFRV
jgi:hypothetical protein